MSFEQASVWRHRRVWLDPACLEGNPVVASLTHPYRQQLVDWVNAGRPLIGRAWTSAEAQSGVPVGLALQPLSHKARIALVVDSSHVMRCEPALPLREALGFLPAHIENAALQVLEEMEKLGLPVAVYGSAFWSHAAQAVCMSPSSDLDLLLRPIGNAQARQCLECLRKLHREGDVRLDGEILLADGSGVAWAELDGRDRVMVKTQWGPALRPASAIWELLA